MSITTILSLKRGAEAEVREWIDDNPGEDWQDAAREIIGGFVPAMTTTLFSLVVQDNSLAFIEVDNTGDDTPFAVLSRAVEQELTTHVHDAINEGVDR